MYIYIYIYISLSLYIYIYIYNKHNLITSPLAWESRASRPREAGHGDRRAADPGRRASASLGLHILCNIM